MAKAASEAPAHDPRRALSLDQVLGNEPIRTFLRRAWAQNRLPQSLLFTGPAGIGKTTLAWALAREIVAEGGDPATHPHALKIARHVHPDMMEITGSQSVSAQIRVQQIRDLEERTSTAPLEAPCKIVLIEPAEKMNEEAANTLLKILEEPPPRLRFLLISAEPNRLLDTIRSRCTPIRLEPVPLPELAAWLRKNVRGVDETKAHLLASLAEGRPGRAQELAKAGMLEARGEILDSLALLMKHGFPAVFITASKFLSLKSGLEAALTMAMTLLRDALVLKTRDGEGLLNKDMAEPLAAFARERSTEGLLEAAHRLEQAASEAPYFYSTQSRAHFVECLITDLGRLLRL